MSTFWQSHESGFYFRLLGFGASIHKNLPVYFSERYGHRRVYRLGRWSVQWLTPKSEYWNTK